jgi:acetoin utilization deacetylase AcuC-like enzyme
VLYIEHRNSLEHDPGAISPNHPDTPGRVAAIEAAMEVAGWPGCERRQAPAASEAELELAHSAMLIDSIKRLCAERGGERGADRRGARGRLRAGGAGGIGSRHRDGA